MFQAKFYKIFGALLVALGFAITACNTVEGVGRDVKSTGKALEDSARRAKN